MKITTRAIALILFMGFFHVSFAQLNPKFGLRGSFISSYNSADFYKTENASFSSHASWGFGAFLEIPFSEKWGMEASLNYAALGTKINGYFLNTQYTDKQTIKYNYLTLPLLAKYSIGKSGLSAMVGPQFGFLMSANRVSPNGDKTNVKSYLKSNDISGLGGLEYKLPLKSFKNEIRVGAKYQVGLTNIIKNPSNNSSNKFYNNAIYGTVAYVF